ncbi:MAG: Fe-S protein assembly chaperone HscA [Planctomycetia bacterium]
MSEDIVGIDLGTTFSLAAFSKDGKPFVVKDENGVSLIPSVICFNPDGKVLVGTQAKIQAGVDSNRTIFSIKRLIGKTLADLKQDLPYIPYQIRETELPDGRKSLTVLMDDKDLTPEEISAKILLEVKRIAGNPQKAVITVPAYFNDLQRQATRDAGRIAGLEVIRIINEPTAAALAYGLDKRRKGNIIVYDLGGGTFDCSILSIADGVFKVLSTHGDTHLGGDDFDILLAGEIASKSSRTIDSLSKKDLHQLRQSAETAKKALSNEPETTVHFLGNTITITREKFESLAKPLVEKSMECCKTALKDAGIGKESIDEMILVGGSSRIPLVQKMAGEFLGKKPLTSVHPDEAIAIGAAIQAEILSGKRRNLLLLDVIPLSLGVETLGGVVSKLIHRNTTIPAIATERFSTGVDNQTGIVVNIYQGERELTKDCKHLGKFTLSGIPPMPAQMPQVELTFLVDASGLLTVSAKELRSNVEASVKIQPSSGLTNQEIEKLVLESVEHAREDFQARQLIEFRNKAKLDVGHAKRLLSNKDLALTIMETQDISNSIRKVESACEEGTWETIKRELEKFQEVLNPFASRAMDAAAKNFLKNQTVDQLPELGDTK